MPNNLHINILTLLLLLVCPKARAQQFTVESFRSLDNDVTAFISPVFDLAKEPCALLRVVASTDFAFSSPLGIVKRVDDTGEILLYLPKDSKSLTIKHPQWGVMRDYRFAQKLLSQHTYELRIAEPQQDTVVMHDTITRTVTDTVTIVRQRPRFPLRMQPMLTAGLLQGDFVAGAMFAVMRRHGAYVHPQWNLHGGKSCMYDCDADGFLPDGAMPYYTGTVHRSSFMVTAGAIHRLSSRIALYEGVGWGSSSVSWQMLTTPGSSSWARNTARSHQGIAFELGTMLSFNKWTFSLNVSSIAAKAWGLSIALPLSPIIQRHAN